MATGIGAIGPDYTAFIGSGVGTSFQVAPNTPQLFSSNVTQQTIQGSQTTAGSGSSAGGCPPPPPVWSGESISCVNGAWVTSYTHAASGTNTTGTGLTTIGLSGSGLSTGVTASGSNSNALDPSQIDALLGALGGQQAPTYVQSPATTTPASTTGWSTTTIVLIAGAAIVGMILLWWLAKRGDI